VAGAGARIICNQHDVAKKNERTEYTTLLRTALHHKVSFSTHCRHFQIDGGALRSFRVVVVVLYYAL
jgi:hypothetical protein